VALLSALQFGLSGLSAILFIVTVRILQTEQKRQHVRAEVLLTLRIVMAFAAFLVIVPAGIEIAHLLLDTKQLNAKISEDKQMIDGLKADKSALEAKKNELTANLNEMTKLVTTVREKANGLSYAEETKGMYILEELPSSVDQKRFLLQTVKTICDVTFELRQTLGPAEQTQGCNHVAAEVTRLQELQPR
jgi:cell division protein FtsB